MNVFGQVFTKVKAEYSRTITKKLKLIDAFLVYCVATGVAQLLYMVFVGTFPFNSFLSGFICHVALFALGVSLRLQYTSPGEFKNATPQRATWDFILCGLVHITQMSPKRERTSLVKPTIPFFRKIHDFLLPLIESDHSNMMVAQFQRYTGLQSNGKVTNKFFNYLFRLASTCGEEIFGLMPLLFWFMLPLALPFSTNFLSLLMIGQLLKDFIMLPRPVGNCDKWKIIKLDPTFETEFGMPSSHTMSSYLPLTMVQALSRQGFVPPSYFWIFSIVYSLLVAFSRLYLGVHSVYDVIGGAILGLGIVICTDQFGDWFDQTVYFGDYGIYITAVVFVCFITVYPKPTKDWAASYGTSAQVVGTWLGVSGTIWYVFHYNAAVRDILVYVSIVPCPHLYSSPIGFQSTTTLSPPVAAVARAVVAVVTAGVVKVAFKPIFVKFFTFLIKSGVTKIGDGEDKDVFGREVPLAKAYWVEVPVRLLNYGSLAWATVFLAPFLWKQFNLV